MKIFFYKSLFIFIALFILFEVTIGSLAHDFEKRIDNYFSKNNIENYKIKIRDELQDSTRKDRILKKEDAKLLGQFLKKIESEISEAN